MSTTDTLSRIYNGNGAKYESRGKLKRAERTIVELEGTDIAVEYFVEGFYMEATATDPAEYPVCVVKRMEIGGVDVTNLLSDTRIEENVAELIEEGWKA